MEGSMLRTASSGHSDGKKANHPPSPRTGNAPRKLLGLLGPLLGSTPSATALSGSTPPSTTATPSNILPATLKPSILNAQGKPVVVSLFAVGASDSDSNASSERTSHCDPNPATPVDMRNFAQSLCTSSNRLTEYMNKMRLAEPAVSKKGELSSDGAESTSSSSSIGTMASIGRAESRSSAPTPRCKAVPNASASLDKLLESARNCALPCTVVKPAGAEAPAHIAAATLLDSAQPVAETTILTISQLLPLRMGREAWNLADYHIGDKLYTGYASKVYKAVCKRSSETVVLKIYTLAAVCDLYKFQIYREVRLHSKTCHANIVHLYAAFQEGDQVVLVQEYADGADLFHLLHKYGGRLSERLAVQMVMDPFLRVLHHLHTNAIVHRDIKPENIMFTKEMGLKLGDFGLAIDLREERAVTRAGTLDYMAPEVLKCPFKSRPDENKLDARLHYSNRVDAWASRTGTEKRILTSTPVFPATLSEAAKSFICYALQKDAINRPTTLEMLHHPWVESFRQRRSMRPPLKNHITHIPASIQTLAALQAGPNSNTPSPPPSPLPVPAALALPAPGLHRCKVVPLARDGTSSPHPDSPPVTPSVPLSAEFPSLGSCTLGSVRCPPPVGVLGSSLRRRVDSTRSPTAQLRTRLTLGVLTQQQPLPPAPAL
ncbi:MAG: hypothetical protein WDW38_004574 [Sanguina aurantia]